MRKEQVTQAYTQIEKTVNSFVLTSNYLLKFYSREDLTQEVFTHFLEKEFFQKYDPSITSFNYFVARAAKNHLIDKTRKRVHLMASLNEPIVGKDGSTTERQNLLEEKISDSESYVLLKTLLEKVDKSQISPNYNLSWKELLGYLIEGKDAKQIHHIVGISSARVGQLIKILRDNLKLDLNLV